MIVAEWRKSGFETGGVVGPGLKTGVMVGPKIMWHRIEGIIPWIFI